MGVVIVVVIERREGRGVFIRIDVVRVGGVFEKVCELR